MNIRIARLDMKRPLAIRMTFVLFFLLPFHVFLMYVLQARMGFGMNDLVFILIKMWKELAVLVILFLAIITRLRFPLSYQDRLRVPDVLVLLFVAMGFVYMMLADSFLFGLWSFRTLFFVYLMYFLGRLVAFEIDDFVRLIAMIAAIATFTSIFAVVQVELLGAEFQSMAYGVDETRADLTTYGYERQRATSTFITAHEFGLFLVFSLFSIPFLSSAGLLTKHPRRYRTFIIVILVGLAYSVSRSSLVILLLGYMYFVLKNGKYLIPSLAVGVFLAAFLFVLGATENIGSIFSGEDPSSTGRPYLIKQALDIVGSNPFGIGLGEAGVVVRRFRPNAPQFEGDWFNILVQMGFAGALLSLSIYVSVYRKALKIFRDMAYDRRTRNLAMYIIMIIAGLLLRDLILPRDQMNFWYGWFMIGAFMTIARDPRVRSGGTAKT